MAILQLRSTGYAYHHHQTTKLMIRPASSSRSLSSSSGFLNFNHSKKEQSLLLYRNSTPRTSLRRRTTVVVTASSNSAAAAFLDSWKPDDAGATPSLSDILWPSAGAFATMAILGKMDQMLLARTGTGTGISMTIAPLGPVCVVLFVFPSSPAARKYNMFMAQINCAAIGVLALSVFGPGWLARSTALAASIAFMLFTRSVHPPAASLPLLFIDGPKFHHLNFWYALFPGATGCLLLCLIQQVVCYMKDHYKF